MTQKYLQNNADIRMTISPKVFTFDLAVKYPFIEPGKAIPVDSAVLDKVFKANKTWAMWKEKGLVKVVEREETASVLVKTLEEVKAPADLDPEQEGGKLEATKGTNDAPKGGKK